MLMKATTVVGSCILRSRHWSQTIWAQIPILPFEDSIYLGKLFSLSLIINMTFWVKFCLGKYFPFFFRLLEKLSYQTVMCLGKPS